jgi:16S rRNA (guanine966-N2)-methyltransferase
MAPREEQGQFRLMRIVGGRFAGTDLTSPGGRVRPTAEELRVAWMELLGDALDGARVLELYAGTGAVGLEALSRGARSADFVENNPSALHSLKANVAALRVTDRTRIFKKDALRWVHRLRPGSYDIVVADPPYGSRQANRLVDDWHALGYAAVLTLEHAADHALPPGATRHVFGDSAISIFAADG